ncbi:MAG TPA: hypothetical protein DCG47_00590 [Spirochaetaceae bacterium]|nr:hypothetical protein [Spirochaetaceae bacterium]
MPISQLNNCLFSIIQLTTQKVERRFFRRYIHALYSAMFLRVRVEAPRFSIIGIDLLKHDELV